MPSHLFIFTKKVIYFLQLFPTKTSPSFQVYGHLTKSFFLFRGHDRQVNPQFSPIARKTAPIFSPLQLAAFVGNYSPSN